MPKRWTIWGIGLVGVGLVGALMGYGIVVRGSVKRHAFAGMCASCHVSLPRSGAPYREVHLRDQVDRLCARCHHIADQMSHPVGVKPRNAIPLQAYLDEQGRLTCVTCHEVHKEERVGSPQAANGLLRGHVTGAAFCATCHSEELPGAGWRHQLALSHAHLAGRLQQEEHGTTVDQWTAECLGCHDGALSSAGQSEIRLGNYQHSVGITHPVGVAYPRNDASYVPREALPETIPLFDGTVGCVSCHNLYHGQGPNQLTVALAGSALCLSCHRK